MFSITAHKLVYIYRHTLQIYEDIDNHSMLKSTSCIYFNLPKQKNRLNELGIWKEIKTIESLFCHNKIESLKL